MTDINRVAIRNKLASRNEPYWRHLEGTGYIGFRKTKSDQKWKAKWSDDEGKRYYSTIGRVGAIDNYSDAAEKARAWFRQCEQGVPTTGTVKEACKAYVEHIKSHKKKASYDPEQRFKQTIYSDPIAKKRLDKMRKLDVERWFKGLVNEERGEATANRILRTFKAAMNYAFESQMVASDAAWKPVKAFPAAEGKREIFLTQQQTKDMLDAAPADLKVLLKGFIYTGCRPGELPKATMSDLDLKAGVLTLSTNKSRDGSVRTRQVPLAGEALTFFKEQAKSKLPDAYLFTMADGRQWQKQEWSREIRKLRENVDGLPAELVAYHIRHTTISNWLSNGVNLVDVAQITGTSIGMIEKNYYQFIPTNVADQLSAIKLF